MRTTWSSFRPLRSGLLAVLGLFCATALLACQADAPANGTLECAKSAPLCPEGFYCASDSHTCWRTGSAPDASHDQAPVSADGPGSVDLAPVDLPVARVDARAEDGAGGPVVDVAGPTLLDAGSPDSADRPLLDAAALPVVDAADAPVADLPAASPDGGESCDASGACKAHLGQACSTSADCTGGATCSPEGICCDRACTGSCEACDLAASPGTCTTLSAGATPHRGHPACTGSDAVCGGRCDGTSAQCFYSTDTCGTASCSSSTYQAPGHCSAGACQLPAVVSCPNACVVSANGCTGTCIPNSKQCSSGIPQVCGAAGAWQDQPACAAGFTCQAGACTCSKTTCGTACVDVQSDPANCGRCGHACQGGGCSAGKCQPVPILDTTYAPVAIAVDATSVYWAESQDGMGIVSNGSIKKAPLAGGGSYTVLAAEQQDPFAIAVNASGVFWLNGGDYSADPVIAGLMWMASNASIPTQVATAYSSPIQLALSATDVYWFDSTGAAPRKANLLELPLSALGPAAMPTVTSSVAGCVYAPPVLVGSSLYWIDSGCFANAGTVLKYTLGATSSTSLLPSATNLNGPYSRARIAADASNVYFGANNSSSVASIESVAEAGGNLSVVLSASVNGVAIDASYYYWTDSAQNAVMARAISGGQAITLASGQANPYDITVDADSVYWTNNPATGAGSVMKVAKP